ncbi:siderophore biosynthesis protein [Tumebacillus algifaecis]|uniref:Siderophore biosynthesis protein n=1 Tax=Tumebacillus algifaecis TaxID=1214604 RepID=A0A223CXT6_9BACL|nr:IucA/IucC family protein [Tumebacillus algifaecis]ASS74025.1 siderophore biosynthesis protein [Tumebacillus algifaecis]
MTVQINQVDSDHADNPVAALQSVQYVEVRRRIFRQLLESLIYEGVLPAEETEVGGEPGFAIEGRTEGGEVVTYLARGKRKLTFDRIRLSRQYPILRQVGNALSEAESLAQFLLEVRTTLGGDQQMLTHFINELEQTHAKDTLAQFYRHQKGISLRDCGYDEMEGNVMDGHPYHPSYKSRIGFDFADNYQYGPEFTPDLYPIWVAAHKSATRFSISKELHYPAFLEAELGSETWQGFTEQVRAAGQSVDDYYFLPVHPWQWQKQVVTAWIDDLRAKRLIVLGPAKDAYRPQQSIRTLANHSAPHRSYIKLSMSLINTSTTRVLAPHTVQNAALVSDWLKRLALDDAFLRDELRTIMLGEVMGISYDPPVKSDLLHAKTYGILGCIWRESLHRHLLPGEAAIPFNALTALDLDGRPLIEPWVKQYGAEAWLRQLFTISVLPLAHFLYAHGIALETHAQNAILVHEQGLPSRLALKDFHDGIRFSKALLGKPNELPALHRTPEAHTRINVNSFIETEDLGQVRDFMHDAFFFINIGELALVIDEFYGVEETDFWRLVREVLEGYQQRFPELKERFALFDLFTPMIEVEQLTKRRFYPDTELRMHKVPNPLAVPANVGQGVK